MVPLRRPFATVLRRETALAVVPSKRLHGRAVDGEHVAVRGEPLGLLPGLLLVLLRVTVVEHLHFDAAQERHAWRGDGRAPDEDSGVATAGEMPPLDFEDEILVWPRGAQGAGGTARAMNPAIDHAPRLRRTIGVHPARQITAIEERDKPVVLSSQRGA